MKSILNIVLSYINLPWVGLAILGSSSAFANEVMVIQAGQTFLPAEMEEKVGTIEKSPSALRAAAVKSLSLKAGDSIIFKNLDTVSHNVYSSFFNLERQDVKETKKQIFDKVGTFEVKCLIHPKMKFTVIVQ